MAAVEIFAHEAIASAFAAIHAVHVRRRPAQIIDIALEILVLRELFDLAQYRFLRAGYDSRSLVKSDGAEAAVANATPVGDHAELHPV
jgi:hypothetical protein